MHPFYAAKLGLAVRKTDVGAKKISGYHPETFGIVDSLNQSLSWNHLFEKYATSVGAWEGT